MHQSPEISLCTHYKIMTRLRQLRFLGRMLWNKCSQQASTFWLYHQTHGKNKTWLSWTKLRELLKGWLEWWSMDWWRCHTIVKPDMNLWLHALIHNHPIKEKASLSKAAAANQALYCQVNASFGQPPHHSWKHRPGRPCNNCMAGTNPLGIWRFFSWFVADGHQPQR